MGYVEYRPHTGDPRDGFARGRGDLYVTYSFRYGGWLVCDEETDALVASFRTEGEATAYLVARREDCTA